MAAETQRGHDFAFGGWMTSGHSLRSCVSGPALTSHTHCRPSASWGLGSPCGRQASLRCLGEGYKNNSAEESEARRVPDTVPNLLETGESSAEPRTPTAPPQGPGPQPRPHGWHVRVCTHTPRWHESLHVPGDRLCRPIHSRLITQRPPAGHVRTVRLVTSGTGQASCQAQIPSPAGP